MSTQAIDDLLSGLPDQHRSAVEWFEWHSGTVQPWPDKLADGTFLATKAKGIYKPAWSEHTLSVRQTIGGPYPDKEPARGSDNFRVLLAPPSLDGPYGARPGQPLKLPSLDAAPSREALRLHRIWSGLGEDA